MKKLLIFFLGLALALSAVAQNNEVGLLLGGVVTPDPSISSPSGAVKLSINGGLALQATYAHYFASTHQLGLAVEVPFVASPLQNIESNLASTSRNYASLFITPGIRARFLPESRVSPWASVGGGYSRFTESKSLASGQPNPFQPGVNKGALQFGGGVDWKTPFHVLTPLILRAEVRDFYTGQPRINVRRTDASQHNVVLSGGIVLRF